MQYNDVIQQLIGPEPLEKYATTDVGTREVLVDLQNLTCADLFPDGYEDADMASCCLSGLWLLHNFLREGHEICQDIDTPAGSFWHAIMHRAEGDYSNSKYWYRLAKTDPFHADISTAAGQPYEPEALVDAVRQQGILAVHDLVTAEWQVLFNHCYTEATGTL